MPGERIVIAGGGAAGFFAAIACAQARGGKEVFVLERSSQFLSKVRISGGGRCNVTHAALDPRTFSTRYPRGERALIAALHRFSPEDTIAWFQRHGVRLKVEPDGRMFPVTDSSGTVIDCLMFEAKAAGVQPLARKGVEKARRNSTGGFDLTLSDGTSMSCHRLLLATGGARTLSGPQIAETFGHTIEPPVPSLFSFHISTPWLRSLPGVSLANVELAVIATKLRQRGALLITHNGVSGPAVLWLSAWGARLLAEMNYYFTLRINWLPDQNESAVTGELRARRETQPKRQVASDPFPPLPSRLWGQLVHAAGIPPETIWTTLSRSQLLELVRLLTRCEQAG
jgi:predicted Rossmann fold flavoprotein